jgi:hypothetical protein
MHRKRAKRAEIDLCINECCVRAFMSKYFADFGQRCTSCEHLAANGMPELVGASAG